MTGHEELPRVVSASREIAAGAGRVFELIADPAQQPRWDGNDNLATAADGQRVAALGAVFRTTLTQGSVRANHVVESEEGRLIAWRPAEPGDQPPGHLWRWELEPISPSRTRVTHTYDWSRLTDEGVSPRPGDTGRPAPCFARPACRRRRARVTRSPVERRAVGASVLAEPQRSVPADDGGRRY